MNSIHSIVAKKVQQIKELFGSDSEEEDIERFVEQKIVEKLKRNLERELAESSEEESEKDVLEITTDDDIALKNNPPSPVQSPKSEMFLVKPKSEVITSLLKYPLILSPIKRRPFRYRSSTSNSIVSEMSEPPNKRARGECTQQKTSSTTRARSSSQVAKQLIPTHSKIIARTHAQRASNQNANSNRLSLGIEKNHKKSIK